VPAAVSHYRAFLLAAAGVLYPVIFATFMLAERPGLGLGHFYYFPVAMVALACGALWGVAAGLVATGLYSLGIIINPHLASSQVLTNGSIIRLITLTTMGALVGWFATNHRDLSDRLRIANERDHVTGLLNTRAFDAALTGRLEQGRPFGLVLADMDNMREINDAEGHAVGNDLLRHAGDILSRTSEGDAQVARIGGDEFAVLLPGSDAAIGEAVLGSLDQLVALNNQYYPDHELSISAGIATSRPGDRLELVVKRADLKMLHAKRLYYLQANRDRRGTGTA
jgi:diguanylate cyclase (GGDEF)-like protein